MIPHTRPAQLSYDPRRLQSTHVDQGNPGLVTSATPFLEIALDAGLLNNQGHVVNVAWG